MFIVYSFGVLVMVYLGRSDGWDWFANEWYNVHIKSAIAGAIWIYAYASSKHTIWKRIGVICTITISLFGLIGNYYGILRAPKIHSYYEGMQKYLYVFDVDDMPVDEISGNTPLLHSLDTTMKSIEVLKKYNLSVYQYWDAFEECPSTAPLGNEIKYLDGIYDDGWVEQECAFSLYTDKAISLEVFYFTTESQNLQVLINGECVKEKISLVEGKSSFLINCEPYENITIELQSDFSKQLAAPDTRVCSYILDDVVRVYRSEQ